MSSRFIDKLDQVSRPEPQPIGFRTKQPASPKPKIQLVAILAQEGTQRLADQVAGADAGLLRISEPSLGGNVLQKVSQTLPDIPWGVWLKGDEREGIRQAIKADGDFVVFPTGTPLAVPENDEVGKILEVEASISEGLLRAVNEMPIDAVLIAVEEKEDYFLTWQHLMLFQRFADLLSKPLLVPIPAKVTAVELQALWEAGVVGVVTEVTVEQSQYRLKELRQVIDRLAFPLPRKREKAEPLIPRISQEPEVLTAEEEEEEEE